MTMHCVRRQHTKTSVMKGTEVPNPRRSSACDCWLEIDHCLVTLSCLPYALFCSCPCKVCSRVSDALSQALCNLSLAFLADFTLSDSTAPIRFIVKLFSLANYTLLFVWIRRKTRSLRSHVFRLTGTAALHCGHTFVRGILLPMSNNWTHKECLSQEQNGR